MPKPNTDLDPIRPKLDQCLILPSVLETFIPMRHFIEIENFSEEVSAMNKTSENSEQNENDM